MVAAEGQIIAKNEFYPLPLELGTSGELWVQTRRVYQVQLWPNGQWSAEHNWEKVEAASEKEAAEKLSGLVLREQGKLAQLRARVLKLGDLKQRAATSFYAADNT